MGETLNERLRRAAEMARQRQQMPGVPSDATSPAQQAPKPSQPSQSYQPSQGGYTQPRHDDSVPASEPQQPSYDFSQPARQPEPAQPSPSAWQATEVPSQPADYNPAPDVPEVNIYDDRPERPAKKSGAVKYWLIALAAILVLAVAALLLVTTKGRTERAALEQEKEQLELALEQQQLSNEYESLNNEFAQYENQTSLLENDSIVQKYSAAKAQVEKLLQELKNEKNKSAAQIAKLKGEIETLKGILRTYVEQINELKQQNQQLTAENEEVKAQNQRLNQTVENVQADNRQLSERMTLAEKLNVTGVTLNALKKNGKNEKNVTKAAQLKVGYSVAPNNSTPPGQKVIYLRLTNPEGQLLGNAGSFPFEGGKVPFTAMKSIEYTGDEVHDQIYWNVTSTLTPGTYTVELFTDGYRLCSRTFTLKK